MTTFPDLSARFRRGTCPGTGSEVGTMLLCMSFIACCWAYYLYIAAGLFPLLLEWLAQTRVMNGALTKLSVATLANFTSLQTPLADSTVSHLISLAQVFAGVFTFVILHRILYALLQCFSCLPYFRRAPIPQMMKMP
jgi:hypothetical protein